MADREQRSPELDEFERHLSDLTPRPQNGGSGGTAISGWQRILASRLPSVA